MTLPKPYSYKDKTILTKWISGLPLHFQFIMTHIFINLRNDYSRLDIF